MPLVELLGLADSAPAYGGMVIDGVVRRAAVTMPLADPLGLADSAPAYGLWSLATGDGCG